MHRKLRLDAICEEFIDGTEVSVTLLGSTRRTVILPVCEWIFAGEVSFLTERAKWDQEYRKIAGVGYRAAEIAKNTFAEVSRAARVAYAALRMRDYGRVDLRIARDGTVYFLDGNANFGLRPVSATMNSLPFEEVIRRIVESARKRGRPS